MEEPLFLYLTVLLSQANLRAGPEKSHLKIEGSCLILLTLFFDS